MLTWFLDLARHDERLAAAFLADAPAYGKMPPERRRAVVRQALAAGRELAARSGGRTVQIAADELGVQVAWCEEAPAAGVVRLAGYEPQARRVLLFRPGIGRLQAALRLLPPGSCPGLDAADVVLAHELYHAADTHVTPASTADRVLGPRHHVEELSAHAFAKELSDWPFLPCGLEMLVHVAEGRWAPDELRARLEEAET